jgi:hypothetical protein
LEKAEFIGYLIIIAIIFMIAGLFIGFMIGYKTKNCQEEISQIEKLKNDLLINQNTINGMQLGYQSCINALEITDEKIIELEEKLKICEQPIIFECDINKYSIGCEDVPDGILYNKQSHYPCYWEFREAYPQFGNYLDVGTICMSTQIGWKTACNCVEQMSGDVYTPAEVNFITQNKNTGGVIIEEVN